MKTKGLLKTLFALSLLVSGNLSQAQNARVQVIHNSADALVSEVDVYLGSTLILDDFAFRTASPYIDAPAGSLITISIALSNSTSVLDAVVDFDYTLTDGETYILVADGIVSPMGYSPATPFGLSVYALGREEASMAGNTDVLVHHGSTDAPTVDVVEVGVGAGTIVNDAPYGAFAGYLELATDDYVLEVRNSTGTVTVASYDAPLATLGLEDSALVVVASGFLDPTVNSNGPAFGLWVALPEGGDLIELPVSKSRVQVIHNSADLAAATVDVYLNGDMLLDNFAFRTASPFVDLNSGVTNSIAIAPGNSTSVLDELVTIDYVLESGATYILVADGIISGSGYAPATPFSVEVYDMGREVATVSTNTDVLVHHGSTDAPTVDVVETGAGAGTIVNDAAYGDFAGYLELVTADYIIAIKDQTGTTTVASYAAPLATLNLDGAAIVVVASGFLDPTVNSNGEAFGLWVALPAGGNLVELPVGYASIDEVGVAQPSIFPNPANENLTINLNGFEAESIQIISMDGKVVYTNSIVAENFQVDLSAIENGLYLVQLTNASGVRSQTIQVIK
jgi:hypothetical protein